VLIFFIFANLRLFLKTLGRVFNFLEVSLVILELKNISKTYLQEDTEIIHLIGDGKQVLRNLNYIAKQKVD